VCSSDLRDSVSLQASHSAGHQRATAPSPPDMDCVSGAMTSVWPPLSTSSGGVPPPPPPTSHPRRVTALIMELVQGVNLSERIRQRPMEVGEVLQVRRAGRVEAGRLSHLERAP